MEIQFNREQSRRLENTYTVEYLSTLAGILNRSEAISSKDLNDFRVSLRNLQQSGDFSQHSVLSLLMAEKNAFIMAVIARYGETGMCSNLFRFSLHKRLGLWQKSLADQGEELLRKAQLFFNQPFYVFQDRRCDRKVLYSGMLVELADILASTHEAIQRGQIAIGRMQPADLAIADDTDLNIDLAVAQETGFSAVQRDLIPLRSERLFKTHVHSAATILTETLQEFLGQLRLNSQPGRIDDLINRCVSVQSEIAKFGNLDFPVHPTIDAWEGRRLSFCQTLSSIADDLSALFGSLLAELSPISLKDLGLETTFTEATLRTIATDLIKTGISPEAAWTACLTLVQYSSSRGLKPSELVAAELEKMNPHLSERQLNLLKAVEQNSKISHFDHRAKQLLLSRSSTLLHFFKTGIGLVSACLLILMTGCGLKTLPQSPLEDYRPDIPMKNHHTLEAQKESPATPPKDQNHAK